MISVVRGQQLTCIACTHDAGPTETETISSFFISYTLKVEAVYSVLLLWKQMENIQTSVQFEAQRLGPLPYIWRHYVQKFSENGGTMWSLYSEHPGTVIRPSPQIEELFSGLLYKSRHYVQSFSIYRCDMFMSCLWWWHYVQGLSMNQGTRFRASYISICYVYVLSIMMALCSGPLYKSRHSL